MNCMATVNELHGGVGAWSLDDSLVVLGEGNGNPCQYSCLENPMNRGGLAGYSPWVARVGHNLASEPPGDTGQTDFSLCKPC